MTEGRAYCHYFEGYECVLPDGHQGPHDTGISKEMKDILERALQRPGRAHPEFFEHAGVLYDVMAQVSEQSLPFVDQQPDPARPVTFFVKEGEAVVNGTVWQIQVIPPAILLPGHVMDESPDAYSYGLVLANERDTES